MATKMLSRSFRAFDTYVRTRSLWSRCVGVVVVVFVPPHGIDNYRVAQARPIHDGHAAHDASAKMQKMQGSGRRRSCERCSAQLSSAEWICPKCECLQSPDPNVTHFTLFDIDEEFDVDLNELNKKMKQLQRIFHPDKFSQRNEMDRQYSAIYSAKINAAYKTLLNPFERGAYLMQLKGKPLQEGTTQMNHEFLLQVMQVNEVLHESPTAEQLDELAKDNSDKLEKCIEKFSRECKAQRWEDAQTTLAQMRYYINIDDKVKSILHDRQLGKL